MGPCLRLCAEGSCSLAHSAIAADTGDRTPARDPPAARLWGQAGLSLTETKGVRSHIARDGPGSRAGPAGGPPSDTRSPCSTSPSPSPTAPRRRGRSPSTSPTSAATAPRAASTASSSTSPGEPCPAAPALTAARPASRGPRRGAPRASPRADVPPTSSPSSASQVSCPGSYSASRVQVWVLACPLLPRNLGSLASSRSRCALQ